jgi:hypothetical protein
MNSLEYRVTRLESRGRAMVVGAAAFGLCVGLLIAASRSPSTTRLVGTGLTIVDADGRPVIDLAPDPAGGGRMHVRNAAGTAEVVLRAGPRGGGLDLFSAAGQRQAKLGSSPTGDGMLLLSDAAGASLIRVGRWESTGTGRVWIAPLSEPATP